jgi:ArsR family transcriptional regulator
VLGHPVRIRILELLGNGERTVGELQAALDLDSSGISQHLAALRRQGVIDGRKDGTRVIYRVKDPRTARLLEIARQILVAALSETKALLTELSEAAPTPPRRRAASSPNTKPSRAR